MVKFIFKAFDHDDSGHWERNNIKELVFATNPDGGGEYLQKLRVLDPGLMEKLEKKNFYGKSPGAWTDKMIQNFDPTGGDPEYKAMIEQGMLTEEKMGMMFYGCDPAHRATLTPDYEMVLAYDHNTFPPDCADKVCFDEYDRGPLGCFVRLQLSRLL